MVEEETLKGGLKGGGKEELKEEEWISLNTLRLKKTNIWQDYSTSLKLKRRKERGGFVSAGMEEREGLYSSGGGNINGMSINEG